VSRRLNDAGENVRSVWLDNSKVVAIDGSGSVFAWSLDTGTLLDRHQLKIGAWEARRNATGTLAVATESGVTVWVRDPLKVRAEACRLAGRHLTAEEVRAHGVPPDAIR
jgi:hypothetical protein